MVDDDGFYQAVLDSSPLGFVAFRLEQDDDDSSLRLVYANLAASSLTGIDLRRSVGKKIGETLPWISPRRVRAYARVCRTGQPLSASALTLLGEHGERSFNAGAFPGPARSVVIVLESVQHPFCGDSAALNLSRFLESVLENLPAMMFIKDARDLRFERFNREGEALIGVHRTELIGKSDHDFFPKEQADSFVAKDREVLRRGTVEDIPEEQIQTPSGMRWLHTRKIPLLDEHGEPRHLLGISVDITEKKRAQEMLRASHEELERRILQRTDELQLEIAERFRAEETLQRTEEQLRQAQKMEAIGRLAGGIAHDFNNVLSVVLSYCDLMLDDVPEDSSLRRDLEEVRRAGERAATLTRQLLAFSRQQVLQPRVLDLNEVVAGMSRMLERLLGEDVELELRCAPGLGKVRVDAAQIEQVVMNLVVNARDAMPTGGKLTIETANVELDAEFAATHLGVLPGPHVMLAVSDTGTGMDKETLGRVFEPFFTTKEKGKGTGLGLSTAFGIVKQSAGSIWVYSEPAKGATFKVYLPVTLEASASLPAPARASEMRGSETVLLVEDEDQVRSLAAGILRKYGYRVLEARMAREALALAAGGGPVDLLLTDVVMPEMAGPLLAEKLMSLRPSMRVLFMSGYTDDAVVRHGILEAGAAFLQKPFVPEVLARRVRAALDGAAPATAD
jgi:PAS domain S-box-containing protein